MSKPYLIIYQDDSKRHCNRREFDSIRSHCREVGPRKYLCLIPVPVGRLTSTDTAMLAMAMTPVNLDRLPGPNVIVELNGKRYRECGLENPYSVMDRVNQVGAS